MATPATLARPSILDERLRHSSPGKRSGTFLVGLILVGGLGYIVSQLWGDLAVVRHLQAVPFLLLGLALVIALGFEFVNGFHDTANAVATVIYTFSLPPHFAVVYSGILNFVGVLLSSGAVAFAVVTLLPRGAGFTMVFAVLIAAILWNLATWYKGLPASSSHTLIGSILGVGIADQLLHGRSLASGVNWEQVQKVIKALLLSPLVGFVMAAAIFFLFKLVARDARLYEAPETVAPPPFWIRMLLIFTCGGVSFFHGSNDGQKGMGLIMLILVGTVPTGYALNHAMGTQQVRAFAVVSTQVAGALDHYAIAGTPAQPAQAELEKFVKTKRYEPAVAPALEQMVADIRNEVSGYGSLAAVPPEMQGTVRSQMSLASDALGLMTKNGPAMQAGDKKLFASYRGLLDQSTKFIPTWVKVAVALALGLGTMIGWKRIVVTVGERIGKRHMTYAQGAAAEITAMITIGLADVYGLPVSTTHVLNSGVAGTMAANKSGLQMSTIRHIAMAWVFTLPAAALLSGGLYFVFHRLAV